MYKNNFRILYKSFFLLVIFILIGFLAFSVFFNISSSVKILNKIDDDFAQLDSGFENIEFQITDSDQNLYKLAANSAKNITKNLILFDNVKIEQVIGSDQLFASSDSASFDEMQNNVILNQNVNLQYFAYNAQTEELVFDVKRSALIFPVNLNVESKEIKFSAANLEFDINNKIIISASDISYNKFTTKELVTADFIETDQDNFSVVNALNVEYHFQDVILTGENFSFLLSESRDLVEVKADSNIKMINSQYQITATNLLYNVADSQLHFVNKVKMVSDQGVVEGDALIYDLNSETAKLVSKEKVRTKLNNLE
jgi:lipopolysaccharide export system protein LptA